MLYLSALNYKDEVNSYIGTETFLGSLGGSLVKYNMSPFNACLRIQSKHRKLSVITINLNNNFSSNFQLMLSFSNKKL